MQDDGMQSCPVTHETVEGELQRDGSMLFVMTVPPTATSVEISGCVFDIPDGATRVLVTISTNDAGQTTLGLTPTYEGDDA